MDTTPARQRDKGGDDELAGTVLMCGDRVAWAGPLAVLGTEQQPSEDDVDVLEGDGEETVATGELYTPPDRQPDDPA